MSVVKAFLIAGALGLGVLGLGHTLGWFDEAASVAREEFGPRAALQKYEWFIDQSKAVQKMDADVSLFQGRMSAIKARYASYGDDMSKWPPDARMTYSKEYQNALDDLTAITSQRNNLVREYNAASEKFNWTPFQTRDDMPSQKFTETLAQ